MASLHARMDPETVLDRSWAGDYDRNLNFWIPTILGWDIYNLVKAIFPNILAYVAEVVVVVGVEVGVHQHQESSLRQIYLRFNVVVVI